MSPDQDSPSRIWRLRFPDIAVDEHPATSFVPLPARPGAIELMVDVISQGARDDGSYAVLLSTPDEQTTDPPTGKPGDGPNPNCFLAFSNVQSWGNRLRELGFNCIEAEIGPSAPDSSSPLIVRIPFYSPADVDSTSPAPGPPPSTTVQYTTFVTIKGIDLDAPPAKPTTRTIAVDSSVSTQVGYDMVSAPVGQTPLAVFYRQLCTVPERARPRAEMSARQTPADFRAALVETLSPVELEIKRSRYPDVAPIAGKPITGTITATGELPDWPATSSATVAGTGTVAPIRRPRRNPFGAPTFRFEDVQSIGFRLDLAGFGAEADSMLETLVEPLNFHLRVADQRDMSVTPFRYRAASRTIGIELLRYGKMIEADSPALRPEDFTSQHELVVRVLVGRVDDDTAQARTPAIFVPAIFVDNPWSKVAGRELLGYGKQLAQFCVGEPSEPLSMDGSKPFVPRERPDVSEIRAVRIVPRIGRPAFQELIQIRCPEAALDAPFISAELLRVSAESALGPWAQSDFKLPEFRRSFAQAVVSNGFLDFSSIQAVPVDGRDLPGAWITGSFSLSDCEVAFPAGIATLAFTSPDQLPAGDDVPEAWRTLCGLLHKQTIALPTGEWYRLRCSMDFRVNDLLDP